MKSLLQLPLIEDEIETGWPATDPSILEDVAEGLMELSSVAFASRTSAVGREPPDKMQRVRITATASAVSNTSPPRAQPSPRSDPSTAQLRRRPRYGPPSSTGTRPQWDVAPKACAKN